MEYDIPKGWFLHEPLIDLTDDSIISAAPLVDKPAGKHGWLHNQDGKLVFDDGCPIVFWGSNVTNDNVWKPERNVLNAKRLAKLGINAMRFHKFTWADHGVVTSPSKSTEPDPEKMKKMDAYFSELKAEGIYVTWSHIFGQQASPMDNLASGFVGMQLFNGPDNGYAIVNFAKDIQQLVFELTTNLLNHRNEYTGLRYADDPALAVIELQNEDNVFWCMQERTDAHPYYRALLNRMFSDWLTEKYQTHDSLVQQWGEAAIQEGERLEEKNIYLYSNRMLMGIRGLQENAYRKQRMLDSARFLYGVQNAFYRDYTEAIRKTGYKGMIIGSPWMAGDGMPHYYNLHSDALCDIVDRHAYWGGGDIGHSLRTGAVRHTAMLQKPGGGLLHVNHCQVKQKPFFISEWMSTEPNQWLCEAPILIALYGLGLQGWSGSFSYSIDHTHNIYNANYPPHLGMYPLLSRMIYRKELQEGACAAVTHVDVERFAQEGCTITNLPNEYIAAGKVLVDFAPGETFINKSLINAAINEETKDITSDTGQLHWHYGEHPYVSVNTDFTEGFVGFPADNTFTFAHAEIQANNKFCAVFLSSANDQPLDVSKQWFLTALSRFRHVGMQYNADETEVLDIGGRDIIVEGVNAHIRLKGISGVSVYALDCCGKRQSEIPVTVENGDTIFVIDNDCHAYWYEISV